MVVESKEKRGIRRMAKILTERLDTVLEYSKAPEGNGRCLGHLAGIGAEFNAPTRNGRRYPVELWRNVMASEDFEEGMETLTLFAETNHPEERVDTSLKEVCAVLTKMEIRENEGILWTEFDILDTPQGQLLESLVEYGSKIGVSSRGLGDEIQKDGETIIDPDTYTYYGHDFVVQPAVKSARPEKVESVENKTKTKIVDLFKQQVENATSESELVSLRRLAESINIPNLDSVMESIDNKLSTPNEEGETISTKLEEDLGKLAEENEGLKTQVETLKSAKAISTKKSRRIEEAYKSEAVTARRTLRRLEVKNERLERANRNITEQLTKTESQMKRVQESQDSALESLQRELTKSKQDVARLRSKLKKESNKYDTLKESYDDLSFQFKKLTESYGNTQNEIGRLQNEINYKESEIDTLYEENNSLTHDVEMANKNTSVTESEVKSANSRLDESRKQINQVLDKYITTKCLSEGLEVESVKRQLGSTYTVEDIDTLVEKISNEKIRLGKMPISFEPITAKRVDTSLSPEESQTFNFLQQMINSNKGE